MARKKKQEAPSNTDGWLTTYADLLSLLLCFFVLMYTSSTPDEAKMQWILRSMSNLTGTVVNPVVPPEEQMEDSQGGEEEHQGPDFPNEEGADVVGVKGPDPMTFDDLFNWVADAISENDLSSSVSVSAAEGRLYIRFDSDIMFAGNSYELLASGKRALNIISPGIKAVNEYIASVRVEGHTAPLLGGGTGGVDDWDLSSQRSSEVVKFLDYAKRMVDSEKFQTAGLGKYSPHYSTENAVSNAMNRRVELIITRNSFNQKDTLVMIDMLNYDYELGAIPGGDDVKRHQQADQHDKRGQIAQRINEKYGQILTDEKSTSNEAAVGEWGPVIKGIPTLSDIPENGSNNAADLEAEDN